MRQSRLHRPHLHLLDLVVSKGEARQDSFASAALTRRGEARICAHGLTREVASLAGAVCKQNLARLARERGPPWFCSMAMMTVCKQRVGLCIATQMFQ